MSVSKPGLISQKGKVDRKKLIDFFASRDFSRFHSFSSVNLSRIMTLECSQVLYIAGDISDSNSRAFNDWPMLLEGMSPSFWAGTMCPLCQLLRSNFHLEYKLYDRRKCDDNMFYLQVILSILIMLVPINRRANGKMRSVQIFRIFCH